MVQDYVQFLQGSADNPWPDHKISQKIPEKIYIPDGYVALRFISKRVTHINGVEICGRPFNETGWYYRGKEADLEEAKGMVSEENYKKLQMSGCKKVAITAEGVFPLRAIDQVMANS